MSKTKKPQIRYEWRRQFVKYVAGMVGTEKTHEWRVCWSLYGGNGEFMCGDGGQGYQDKTDARRAVDRVTLALCEPHGNASGDLVYGVREVGPGRKPK